MPIQLRKSISLLLAGLLVTAVLYGCAGNDGGQGQTGNASSQNSASQSGTTINVTEPTVEYKEEDKDDGWDADSACAITLNGTGASVEGDGASAEASTVTITKAGTYVLSGTLTDGQIIISAGQNDVVRLVLNGVTLSCTTSAPIYAKQADKTIIILAEGTVNEVTDGDTYVYADGEDEPDAAIFSKDDLSITGTGSLRVTGNYNNGIGTKDDLVITSGEISVTAVHDCLRGRDSVAVLDGTFTLNAGVDGVKSNNDEDSAKGWVSLDGGVYKITADGDGVQAETVLRITAGEYEMVTGGGSAAAPVQSGGGMTIPGRQQNQEGMQLLSSVTSETSDTATDSMKGLKAGGLLSISGGKFTVDSADDALHSNGDLLIKGGTFDLTTGDDGMHADAGLTIEAGDILIQKCYEGLEGSTIDVNGGNIQLTASDDGLNAAGGNDSSSEGGWMGKDNFKSNDNNYIRIAGGTMQIDAAGDGIDSNGNLYIDGGSTLVNGPTSGGNGAMDYNGACEITGGILVTAGSSGMAQVPSSSSAQNSIAVYYTSVQNAGTVVNLSDKDGASILSFSPTKQYQHVVISTPALQQGSTYTLSSGGSDNGEAVGGLYLGGTYTGGTQLTELTLSGTVTQISDTGSEVSGGMGGMGGGNKGGMGDRGQGGAFPGQAAGQ